MQAICQIDVQGQKAIAQTGKFLAENSSDGIVLKLANSWTRGVWQNVENCDRLITDAAARWQLSRLSLVDRSILRLGTYQLMFCPEMPPKVVINEAIELAKKYSSESSPGFVNGVLDAIRKKIDSENI